MTVAAPAEPEKTTWERVMELKPKDDMKRGLANTLSDDDLNTICGLIDFFGGDYRQDIFDLKVARYRVFDWLAMRVQGRGDGREATKVLAYSFIKSGGVVSKFIEDLRITDYDIDNSWTELELSY